MRWLSRLVTVAVIAVIVVVAAVGLRAKMPATTVGQQFTAWALFRDASRIAVGSAVMIAGVRIGEVSALTVEGDLARVDLRLLDPRSANNPHGLEIPADSWITKRAVSAFGDSYLEIIPTSADDTGAPVRMLASGERIVHVLEGSSTDTVLRAIARTMPRIDEGLETVHDFVLDGRRWSNGQLEDGIARADRWLAAGHIDQPIESADRAFERFENGTAGAVDSVARAKSSVAHQLDRVDRGVSDVRRRMVDFQRSLHDGFASARQGMDRIDPTVEQMAEVMQQIDEGHGDGYRGTLGKLVNNSDLANSIEDTTEGIADGTASLNKFKSWLGARVEYLWFSKETRFYVTAEIRARNDKFFLVELEKGPLGAVPKDELTDSAGNLDFTRYQEIDDGLRFTAQFGKTLGGWLQLRGGVKDSTFGVGSDVLLNDGRLRLSADVFGSVDKTPRLKLAASIAVFRSVYLLAGVDDALNSPGYLPLVTGAPSPVPNQFQSVRFGRDFFLGATLHFDDADLATLIRVYGALIVSAL